MMKFLSMKFLLVPALLISSVFLHAADRPATGISESGYMRSFEGDRPPIPIIDFDLRVYYPPEARKANISSKTVVVRIWVEKDGRVTDARIVSDKAGYGFDEAALAVVRRLKFRPGYLKGKPAKMIHEFPVTFVLD